MAQHELPARRQVAVGSVWVLAQKTSLGLLSIITLVVLARTLSPQEFGLVAFAMSLVGFLAAFPNAGVLPSLVRDEELSDLKESTVFWGLLPISFALAGLLAFSSPLIARWQDEPELAKLIGVLSLYVVLQALRVVPAARLTREFRFKSLAVASGVAALLGSGLAIALALSGFGVWALAAQVFVTASAELLILFFVVRWMPKMQFSWSEATAFLKFASGASSVGFAVQVRESGINLLIGSVLGTQALGIWSIASKLLNFVMNTVGGVVTSVALPTFAAAQADASLLHRIYRQAASHISFICIPICLGLAATSGVAVPLLFGDQWQAAVPVLALLAVAEVFVIIQWLDADLWLALGRPRVLIWIAFLHVASRVLVVAILAVQGLAAAASGLLVLSIVEGLARAFAVNVLAKIPLTSFAGVIPALISGGLMAGGVALLAPQIADLADWLSLAILVGSGAILYLVFSYVFQRVALQAFLHDVSLVKPRN